MQNITIKCINYIKHQCYMFTSIMKYYWYILISIESYPSIHRNVSGVVLRFYNILTYIQVFASVLYIYIFFFF